MKNFFDRYLYNSIALCVVLSITINIIIESVSRKSLWESLDYFINSPMTFLHKFLSCNYIPYNIMSHFTIVYIIIQYSVLAL
jgi:hypothetical protein